MKTKNDKDLWRIKNAFEDWKRDQRTGLRNRAKAALGHKFDMRKFNDALLTSGSMPLDVLDGVIDRFVKGA